MKASLQMIFLLILVIVTSFSAVKHSVQDSRSLKGTLYFTSRGRGGTCLAKARYQNGQYQEPEILGEPFISDYWDGHPCIAPDESWIIFDSENRPAGRMDKDRLDKRSGHMWPLSPG